MLEKINPATAIVLRLLYKIRTVVDHFIVAKSISLGYGYSRTDNSDALCLVASLAYACTESARSLGLPEAAIPLANIVTILATAPKSNTSYLALHAANEDIAKGLGQVIPKHLQSPNFEGYIYPHDFENDYVMQEYLPKDLVGKHYYEFGSNKTEQAAKAYHDMIISSLKDK